MLKYILLDMDGVIADFNTAALRVHGMTGKYHPPGEWDIAKVMGITSVQFWVPVDTYEFWRTKVRPYAGAKQFYDELQKRAPVVIATAPSMSPDSLKAKLEWLREFIDPNVEYMMGRKKSLMTSSGNLLIDDSDANVESFVCAGGEALLMPRLWNKAHVSSMINDPYNFCLQAVDGMIG